MDIHSVDAFNEFLSGLSNQFKSKNHRSTARNDSTELTGNNKPNQLLEQFTEISHADRNRPIFNRTKRLIESTKQLVSRAKQALSQQVNSLKSILTAYSEVEQSLKSNSNNSKP
jgi:hypothetical protein